MGPLSPSRGFTYLLTVVDRFTRWPEAVPLVDISADTVTRAFVSQWIARFGVPSTITTDRGRQFESALWSRLMTLLGSHRIRTTAYHPSANGLVERFHRQLKASLRSHSSIHWVDALPMVMLGIRTAFKEDIRTTAAKLVYGMTLRVPGEFFSSSADDVAADPADFVTQLKETFRDLQAVPPREQQRKVFIHPDLASSTHVFVRHDAVRKSLQPPYDGPFKVLSRSDKHFTIERKGQKDVVSIDHLKPAYLDSHDPVDNSPIVFMVDKFTI